MSEVTQILNLIDEGDPTAASQLLPLVYDELKNLAAIKMRNEAPGHTLQATALVHDAYLRMVGNDSEQTWNGRGHFFAAAAESMRRILVDRARQKNRFRHGGGRKRFELEAIDIGDPQNDEFLEALDVALDGLAEENESAAQIVNLRFFVGFTIEQAAESLGLSVRTANRQWAFAKAWIYQQIMSEDNSA